MHTPLEGNDVLYLEWGTLINAVEVLVQVLVQGRQAQWKTWQKDLNVSAPCGVQ